MVGGSFLRVIYEKKYICVGSCLFLFFASFLLACFFCPVVRDAVSPYFSEDAFVEDVSALFYLVGTLAAFVSFVKAVGWRAKMVPLLLCVFCFVCFGEETSWCQRIFDYNVEFVEAINDQGEFNMHNLELFQRDFDDGSIFRKLLNAQALFRYVYFGYFVGIPFLVLTFPSLSPFFRSFGDRVEAKYFIWSPLLLVFFSFVLVVLSNDRKLYGILSEFRELVYAVCLGVHAVLLVKNLREKSESVV